MVKGTVVKNIANIVNAEGKVVSQKVIAEVLDAYKAVILDAFQNGEDKVFAPVGLYVRKHCAERKGVNRLTDDNAEWVVPEHDEITMHIGKSEKMI